MRKWISLGIVAFAFSLSAVAEAAPVEHWSEVKVPRPDIFKGWKDNAAYVTSHVPFMSLPRVKACNDKPLMPTGPSQMTKLYHEYKWGEYSLKNLFGDDPDRLCRIHNNNSKQKYCARADLIFTVVISDLYKDDCGKTFRGFWRQTFLQQDETMGALQSLGRSLVKVPNSPFPKDFMPGPSNLVGQSAFMFLTEEFKE